MIDYTFWAVAILAVFIVGLSKSGLVGSVGMVAVPLLALVMPARDATGMMLPVLLAMDAIAIWVYRKDANWQVLRIMLPGAVVGTILGWLLWSVVTDAQVLLAVGIITVLFMLDALLPLRKRLPDTPPSRFWGNFWGGAAGLTSFISHTGGPPYQIYTLPLGMTPTTYAASTAFFFAIVNTMKLAPFFFLGQLSVSNLELSAALIPFGLAGVGVGVYLVRRISAKAFYTIAYALILLLGVKLLYDGIMGVFFTTGA
ncbi:MAG: sulfite exporter TauE/SafE family protein [Hyphomicrobiales bacterium]|nr:MAG: sulfite exporter TauE/SafE family protein [Hyphomicrobiales bacterium]